MKYFDEINYCEKEMRDKLKLILNVRENNFGPIKSKNSVSKLKSEAILLRVCLSCGSYLKKLFNNFSILVNHNIIFHQSRPVGRAAGLEQSERE